MNVIDPVVTYQERKKKHQSFRIKQLNMQLNSNDDLFTFTPIHPTKLYYIAREQTFQHWPHQMEQKAEALIQNGFFYTGVGDRVTCFYCDITLKQWRKNDCIETEHLNWEPNCLFAKIVSKNVTQFNNFQCC